MSEGNNMTGKKRWATVCAVLAISVAMAAPASAATGSGSFDATCDPSNYGYASDGKTYQHNAYGTISVKQTGSNPTLSSSVKVTSQNGNSTSVKTVSDGGTVSWTNVLTGQYKVEAKSSSTSNCNGWLPGNGNYKFSYTITY